MQHQGKLFAFRVTISRDEVTKRVSILLGFSFLQGLSIGPLVGATFDIDPRYFTQILN